MKVSQLVRKGHFIMVTHDSFNTHAHSDGRSEKRIEEYCVVHHDIWSLTVKNVT